MLPLGGSMRVDVPLEATYDLRGRESVFTDVTDFAYLGRDTTATLTSAAGGVVALPSSRCTLRLPPAYGAAEDVPVEIRGAGSSTRQVVNFGIPGVWDHAEKLICCEVITPPGNWSSYPPHKHDTSSPCEVVNEEIYYYRVAGEDQVTPSNVGFGYHHVYTGPEHLEVGLREFDEVMQVRDHDTVLVPHGYHGPCIAAPGYPMYYLNVMAGSNDRRLGFCDDPCHEWVRDTWADMLADVRCTSPRPRVDRNPPRR